MNNASLQSALPQPQQSQQAANGDPTTTTSFQPTTFFSPPPPPQHQQQHHARHMGKKPPRFSKGKNSKRKPPTLKAAGGKQRGRFSKQRSFSRQGSNLDKRAARAMTPQITIINDEEPDRFTNPLLSILPESTRKRSSSITGSTAPVNGSPSSAIASKSSSTRSIIPVTEMMNSAAIVFHRPDTYPISYLARVLGFHVDVPDMRAALRQDDGKPEAVLPPFPTPVPDPQTLPFRKDKIFSQVPPLGKYFEQSKLQAFVDQTSGLGDHDDQRVLDYMDPVYNALLKYGWDANRAKSLTSGAAGKFVQKQLLQRPVRDHITSMAREWLGLSEDWTFQDWTSYMQAQEQKQERLRRMKESPLVTASTPKAKMTESLEDNEPPAGQSIRRRSSVRPNWTIDGRKVFDHIPSHIFGILACYKGQPVLLLKYQFQWYFLPDPTVNQAEENRTESNQPVEAELMMVINGFGQPTGTQVERDETNKLSSENVDMQSENNIDGAKRDTDDRIITLESVAGDSGDRVKMVMLSMALEHTRACRVWYGVWDVPTSLADETRRCFRMAHLPSTSVMKISDTEMDEGDLNENASTKHNGIPMICDLQKCSSRYAILAMKGSRTAAELSEPGSQHRDDIQTVRLLVNLPNADKARKFFEDPLSASKSQERVEPRKQQERKFKSFTSAGTATRQTVVKIQAKLDGNEKVEIFRVTTTNGSEKGELPRSGNHLESAPSSIGGAPASTPRSTMQSEEESAFSAETNLPHCGNLEDLDWNFLRYFPIHSEAMETPSSCEDGVLLELMKKQDELTVLDESLQKMARNLLARSIEERIDYEKPESRLRRAESSRVLRRNEENVRRRKEIDQVWQDQLEQDMNAVCSICDDGEVTPENQILFCEACNVAVHQLCYGIEKVPDGDYYCIACRYFKRDRLIETMSDRHLTVKSTSSAPRVALDPLPICCELCPVKQGAYTQSAVPDSSESKWLHMVCAKWQGLDFVKKNDPSLVEDVTELKRHFRRLEISCCICRGMRGAYNKCRYEGCENWCHVTCARESGLCEVIHGEDVVGFVEENPWTLLCPTHTDKRKEKNEEKNEEKKKKGLSVEFLINSAKEFPIDPMPEPRIETFKPFNKLTGSERKEALRLRSYEDEFIKEILTKKLAGVRCEVCDGMEDDAKSLARCTECGCVVCFACQMIEDSEMQEQRNFVCYGCLSVSGKSTNEEDAEMAPQCSLCHQKGGLLLRATASPISKKSYWKQYPKEYKRSLFGSTRFAHALCAFWSKNVRVNHANCTVNTSNVVMSNGRQFVKGRIRCGLCGRKSGLKSRCVDAKCRAHGELKVPYHFHITCARQAGLEASHDDDPELGFYLKCYAHGSNEHNLRARLEDLIEIEKIRIGKRFSRADYPMTFSVGSKLLNGAILVMRTLGWAWRWAEWWVEFGSSWEPLLEPGQKESNMTAEELRIVESTKESRRDDARRCRLAAFGAALRNRCFDTEEGFNTIALERSIRAILHTPSLVGPLEDFEIEFFVEWLGRAYRSKSRLLGFGDDKIPVVADSFCMHREDGSPKFELGNRPLPGNLFLPEGQIFEDSVKEPDDFLLPERSDEGELLNVESLPEINYRHKGVFGKAANPPKQPLPPGNDNVEPKHKRQRFTETPNPSVAKEKKRRKTCVDAVIHQMDSKQDSKKVTTVGRPKVLQLQVAVRVGGKDYDPSGGTSDVEKVPRDDVEYDWSNVAMEHVLAQQLDFLKGMGIQSVQQFMNCPTLFIAEQLVSYRKEHGLPELKGRSVVDGASKTICSWRSRVRSYAKKEGIDVFRAPAKRSESAVEHLPKDLPSIATEVPKASQRQISVTEDCIDKDANSSSRSKRLRPNETSIDFGEQNDTAEVGVRGKVARRSRGQQQMLRADAEIPRNSRKRKVFPMEPVLEELEREEHSQDERKIAIFSETYVSWRAKKNLSPYSGRSAHAQVTAWKRKVKDGLDSGEFDVDVLNFAATTTDSNQELEKKSADLTESGAKHYPKKKRIVTDKDFSANNLSAILPECACAFLNDHDIHGARSFLQEPTANLSEKLVLWREKHAMPKLRGSGAGATVSSWKTKIRKAAEEAGYIELAELNIERRRKKRDDNYTEDADVNDPGNDKCMFCDNVGRLVICDGCERSCHLECLSPPLSKVPKGDFFCPECKQTAVKEDNEQDNDECMICGEVGDLIICDGCEKSCHMECLEPPLLEVPEDDFFCPACLKNAKRNAKLAVDDKMESINQEDDNDECMICGEGGDLIICDGCEKSCHGQCLDPPLKDAPEGDFFCPTCSSKPTVKDKSDDTDQLNETIKAARVHEAGIGGNSGTMLQNESRVLVMTQDIASESQIEAQGEKNGEIVPADSSSENVRQAESIEPKSKESPEMATGTMDEVAPFLEHATEKVPLPKAETTSNEKVGETERESPPEVGPSPDVPNELAETDSAVEPEFGDIII
ncbi:PHD-finger domain containing protein [Nitzschia inconspicua]|uniref:PHD-finger domain containing protein n=1 Tax=Nitzschia inconspicua TaxID=303405 RepID=A0A9K3KIX1_9STRA|nr:PHD-finger domain containing protein [Nitzschia inconspicua]